MFFPLIQFTSFTLVEKNDQTIDQFEKMSDALYNITQWEVFLRILYNELVKSAKQIEVLNEKLAENYKQITSGLCSVQHKNWIYLLFWPFIFIRSA